jgi:hypothetical protein
MITGRDNSRPAVVYVRAAYGRLAFASDWFGDRRMILKGSRLCILFALISVINSKISAFLYPQSGAWLVSPSPVTFQYFKREVRGITGNYDVIAISTNNDPCKSYDEKMDYRIYSYDKFGNYIYYKMEGDKLHLYGVVANNSPTEEFPLNLKIENHEINFLEWEKFEGNYDKQGITRLLLGIKPENKCR